VGDIRCVRSALHNRAHGLLLSVPGANNDTYLSQKLLTTEQIYQGLNDPIVKMYFSFLSWISPKFNDFNKYYQTEKVVITDLYEKIRTLLIFC